MTTYVLVACSKTKYSKPEIFMHWNEKTDINSWNEKWKSNINLFSPQKLYNGRSFRKQMEIVENTEDSELRIISAGAGLISLSSLIPTYESTFREGFGPQPSDWHNLPEGGIKKLLVKRNDTLVSFAPPQYHRALLNDPDINHVAKKLVVPSNSPLSNISGTVIEVHPRSKEVLGVSSSDLNTEYLRIYLSKGIEAFDKIYKQAENLPPKIKRSSISDDDLIQLISKLKEIKNFNSLVRYLRDDLLIKASVERISSARKQVQDKY
jgi:hypothetical protein